MISARKKVIVRWFEGRLTWGYLPQTGLAGETGVALMQADGRIETIPFSAIKTIAYVRDFNLDDHDQPERLGRRSFPARPRGDGLWVRLRLLDGDVYEGLANLDLSFLDSLVEDSGLFLTPPESRSNTQRLFIPRPAIASMEVLGLILSPARRLAARKPGPAAASQQPNLFSD